MLVLALSAAPGQGEDDFERRHGLALAANPADVSVELTVHGGRTRFFQGEVIPLELAFSSSTPERYRMDAARYDRSGRMTFESFHLEPVAGAVDPLRDYFATGIRIGGGLRTNPVLGEEPEVIELALNEWLRFGRPGARQNCLGLEAPTLRNLAVRRLHDLDPAAVREILLAEMRRPSPRLSASTLKLWPESTLPPAVEAAVVANLGQLPPTLDGLSELSALVGRFGSPAIRSEVEAIYARRPAIPMDILR